MNKKHNFISKFFKQDNGKKMQYKTEQKSATYLAIENGDLEKVQKLVNENNFVMNDWLEVKCEFDEYGEEKSISLTDLAAPMIIMNSPHYSSEQQCLDMLKLIIKNKHSEDKLYLPFRLRENTMFMMAVEKGYLKLCEYLLKNHYIEGQRNFDLIDFSELMEGVMIAIKQDNSEMLDLILKYVSVDLSRDRDRDITEAGSILEVAYESKNLNMFKKIINHFREFDFRTRIRMRGSIIDNAISNERYEELKLMLFHPNSQSSLEVMKSCDVDYAERLKRKAASSENEKIIELVNIFLAKEKGEQKGKELFVTSLQNNDLLKDKLINY